MNPITIVEKPSGVGWPLLAAALALVWLLPTHTAPWTTFYQEVAVAALLTCPLIWAVLRDGNRWRLDWLAAVFALVAFVPLAQAASGLYQWPAEAPLVSFYLFGVGLVVLMASQAERIAPGRLIDTMWNSLLIASLASTGLVLYQWAGMSGLGVLAESVAPHGRPAANIGQPNLLATLLVWGLLALWWARIHGRLGATSALLSAGFLLLGIAATQSRTGWLEVATLALLAIFGRRRVPLCQSLRAWVALSASLAACVLGWAALNALLSSDVGRTAADQMSTGKRPDIWSLMLSAADVAPWVGYGWNQGLEAHQTVYQQQPIQLFTLVQYAHNIVLDLIIWNGWPLGAILILSGIAWLAKTAKQVQTGSDVLLLAGLAVFLLHALLELPHVLFFFLAPVGVMAGTLAARHPMCASWRVPRIIIGSCAVAVVGVLITVFADYRAIEADLTAYRIRMARIGDLRPIPVPRVVVLKALRDELQGLRVTPVRSMSEDQLALLRRAVRRYPSDAGLFNLARAEALNHQPAAAFLALDKLCAFYPPVQCRAAALAWSESTIDGNPEFGAVQRPKVFKTAVNR